MKPPAPTVPAPLAAGHSKDLQSTRNPLIVWLRQDLRLSDNPSLASACESGRPVLLVYILPERDSPWFPGEASRWWLHHSLASLDAQLSPLQNRLVLRRGDPARELVSVARDVGAAGVYWNRCYEPRERAVQEQAEYELTKRGHSVHTFDGSLLVDPARFLTKNSTPYQVFTPFWRAACLRDAFSPPVAAPTRIPKPHCWPHGLQLEELELLPGRNWTTGLAACWEPGEAAALKRWREFLESNLETYQATRNLPALAGTSRLSPHLHFGEITPRRVYHDTVRSLAAISCNSMDYENQTACFLSEIGWREFSYYILYHFPRTPHEPLRSSFADFPWESRPNWLRAWQQGMTGYPIVDAGMRELWQTGWMHNRVRMIVASFLTKDLQIHWSEGARWFWDTLVDADLASNTLGWQWASGCGADAAPYFRIFNPVLQSQKFDPQGDYLRRWCPELARLPRKYLHDPGSAPSSELRCAGVKLGRDYPPPIVDHAVRRDLALSKWKNLR